MAFLNNSSVCDEFAEGCYTVVSSQKSRIVTTLITSNSPRAEARQFTHQLPYSVHRKRMVITYPVDNYCL